MKKTHEVLAGWGVLCSFWFGVAQAMPLTLTGEYDVAASATNLGANTWQFSYQVTNINQGVSGYPYGLDGFAIQVPDSATLVSLTVPASYVPEIAGYWTPIPKTGNEAVMLLGGTLPDPGYHWMLWWGIEPPSVYPPGTVASFSVTLANVSLSLNEGGLVTYWGWYIPPVEHFTPPSGGYYTPYMTELVSPATVIPVPGALLLGGIGTGLLGWLRRRRVI